MSSGSNRTLAERILLIYPPTDTLCRCLHSTFHIGLLLSVVFSMVALVGHLPEDLSSRARIASRTIAALLPYPILFGFVWLPAYLRDRSGSKV